MEKKKNGRNVRKIMISIMFNLSNLSVNYVVDVRPGSRLQFHPGTECLNNTKNGYRPQIDIQKATNIIEL